MTNEEIFAVWTRASQEHPRERAAILKQVPRDEWLRFVAEWPAGRAATRPRLASEFPQKLEVDFATAREYVLNHRRMEVAFSLGQSQLDQFDHATREVLARLKDAFDAELMSPILSRALANMKAVVQGRESIGVEDVFPGHVHNPGMGLVASTKARTPADVAATARARAALAKLEGLTFTPDSKLVAAIKSITDELRAGDDAADYQIPVVEAQPAPVAAPRGFTTKSFAADLEPVLE